MSVFLVDMVLEKSKMRSTELSIKISWFIKQTNEVKF